MAFYNRGIAYYFQKDFDRAIADYDQAIQLNANNVQAYKNRGFAKRAKGDSAGSDADIAKAKQLNLSASNYECWGLRLLGLRSEDIWSAPPPSMMSC
jgi:tetratricopeptide (TPR) repeat protein